MTSGLILQNVVAYSLQIGMLVGLAAFVPALLRLRQPGAKLVYWQILLAACVLLPLQPWRQIVLTGTVDVTTVIATVRTAPHPAPAVFMPVSEIALLVLLAGVAIRLAWLAVGFWKLRRYRRHSRPLIPAPAWGVEASLRLSDDIASPVTFGWRRPVVLLPAVFPSMDARVQEAILCHEIMHVRRRDWVFTVVEEMVRAVFWFHPAIWWLLGEIGLAREQEVDRLAIGITKQREEYMDALLAIASGAGLDLAPAPLFLRKRHLKQRVVLILKEAQMSKTRLISALAAGLGILAAACWLAMGAFPLTAAPQTVNDAPGVTVSMNGAAVMHRTPVNYPPAALARRVEGTVSVEVKLDANGNVSDARVLSGPDELRNAALQSVLQWHFTRDAAGTTRVVGIAFQAPKQDPVDGYVTGLRDGAVGGGTATIPESALPRPLPPVTQLAGTPTPRIKSIEISGLSEQAKADLLASLPVHEGDELTPESRQRTVQAIQAYDEHLGMGIQIAKTPSGGAEASLLIAPRILPPGMATTMTMVSPSPAASASAAAAEGPPIKRIKVGGNVQEMMIVNKVEPVYPPLAKTARVAGVVHLAAVIGKDGTIMELHSLGGPALLIQAAMDAVKQWVYRPTLLNGQPVQVETTIDINFTLAQ
jgi:TonB family protein